LDIFAILTPQVIQNQLYHEHYSASQPFKDLSLTCQNTVMADCPTAGRSQAAL